jgi:small basic protein (TIGR04137 family)
LKGRVVSIDSSLRGRGRLARSRNVLKREERIALMKSEDRWTGKESPFGLAKTRVAKSSLGKKKKKKAEGEEGEAGAEGAAAPAAGKAAPAAAGKAAPAAKAAAPAKGAKK